MASSARSERSERRSRMALSAVKSIKGTNQACKSDVKSEEQKKSDRNSVKSSTSSITAQKKKLELQAAQEKARIEMELIDKQLAADLAALDDQQNSRAPSRMEENSRDEVNKWLEQSQQHLETQGDTNGNRKGSLRYPPPDPDGTDDPVQKLVNAMKELVNASSSVNNNAHLLSRMSTPRDLPVFYGDPMEWLAFKQAYEESTTLCHFTDKENIWRLRRCLRGPAKDAVAALIITATSPSVVMSTLELQFGNPEVIVSKIISDMKKVSPLPHDYYKEIVTFSIRVKNCVAAIRALNRDEYLQGVSVANIILAKLPTVLLSKWTDYSFPHISAGVKTRIEILSEFLSDEAIKISTCNAQILNTKMDKRKYNDSHPNTQTVLVQTQVQEKLTDEKCRFCRVSKHQLPDCKKFKKSLRKDRWNYVKRVGICYKCLSSRHDRKTCPAAACDIDSCGESHHRLLHYVPSSRRGGSADVQVIECVRDNNSGCDSQTNGDNELITHIKSNDCCVLLQVVKINIHGPNGVISAIALLDSGSSVTLISATLAARVHLRGRKTTLQVRGAWNDTGLTCETELVDLTISNKYGNTYTISARSIDELNLPVQNIPNVNYNSYTYLSDLSNEFCTGRLKPEILIGQDNYHLMLPLETVAGNPNEPVATRTPLGWCLHGRAMSSALTQHSTLFIVDDDAAEKKINDLHEEVRHWFSIDSMGISASKPRQNTEDQRACEQLERTSMLVDGKWHVGLPWKDGNCVMPDTYAHALARLKGIEIKMKRSATYAIKYKERVQHLLRNDYAEELKDNRVTQKTWYLPHFGLENPNKRNLRLIFDAASKVEGLCLNDYLLKGPDLLMSLFGIMLRFRENRIAVAADIRDMFLRVKIRPEDRDSLRFIFRGNPYNTSVTDDTKDNELKTYVMTSLIFGANCSPFIAQFIKNKNAQRFESIMPAAAESIYTQHYMDDYIESLPDEETAIKMIRDIMYIHSQGNFELRNWNSNSLAVLDSVPKTTLGDTAVKFKVGQQYEGERTLGLLWYPNDDTLGFETSFKKIPDNIINGEQRPTKRDILRVVMSIFDVYGFLAPFTIIGKIILQDTWRLKITWDECISDEIYTRWQKWIYLLKSVRDVRLPRYYNDASASATKRARERESQPNGSHLHKPDTSATQSATKLLRDVATAIDPASATPRSMQTGSLQSTDGTTAHDTNNYYKQINTRERNCKYTHLQLHIFCDASTKAFCAVAYWRWIDNVGRVCVAFVASRNRVAGNKVTTVPRLELQSALLGARLADTITREHKMIAERRVFWSDSTTVLQWIRNNTRNYKTYIANRLGEIDDLTQPREWCYVPTDKNVADIATRESYDCSVLYQEWLHGPTFLRCSEQEWPRDVICTSEDAEVECVSTIQISNQENDLPVPEPTRFSSWLRLLKATCRVIEFIDKGMKAINKKFKERKYTYSTDGDEMERAEILLLRYSQNQSFGSEIILLKNNKPIPTSSKLLTLSPYLDDHGVLRAAGRIDAAADVAPEKKRPVILDGHEHITRLMVRHYHIQAAHGNQEMVVNNLKQKFWIIKLRPTVKSVTSQCMFCRIRKCKPEIPRLGDLPEARMAHHQRPFSYCGADLFGPMDVTVGRRHEKRYGVLFTCLTIRAVHIELVPTLTTDSFIMALRRMAARRGWPKQMFSDNGTNLRGANTELKRSILDLDRQALTEEAQNRGTRWTFIPAASPHWGGAWERLVRSVKTSLRVILKERAPREETLMTLLTEVENIVNSRPLTHVSVEVGSSESLTPNHFLLGSSCNLPSIGVFDDSDLYLRKQWRISQRLADMFWKRWIREVLPEMVPRRKWNREHRPMQVGDLVFMVDPDSPRNVWPRGKIVEVCPGKDGRVRMVKVKTKTGVLTRSVVRVARIPIDDECC